MESSKTENTFRLYAKNLIVLREYRSYRGTLIFTWKKYREIGLLATFATEKAERIRLVKSIGHVRRRRSSMRLRSDKITTRLPKYFERSHAPSYRFRKTFPFRFFPMIYDFLYRCGHLGLGTRSRRRETLNGDCSIYVSSSFYSQWSYIILLIKERVKEFFMCVLLPST